MSSLTLANQLLLCNPNNLELKIMLINTNNEKISKIGIIFIGMSEVSSCLSTVQIGQKVKKGDQLGYFMFGGSSHVLIFE